MTQQHSVHPAGLLRRIAWLCFTCALSLAWHSGSAAMRSDLYQATVPLADRSEATQTAAFQAALKIVLVRITGRRGAEMDPALAPLIADARRLVQQYRATPDNQIWVAFDGAAVERWLAQSGQPLWGHERPSTFVWLAVASGPQSGAIVTRDDSSDWKVQLEAAATDRGIQLLWPGAAELQNNRLDYPTIGSVPPAALEALGHRLGGDGTLIGHAASGSGPANVRWTFLFQGHSSEFSGPASEAVNRAADAYAAIFAVSGDALPLEIEVDGLDDVREYATVQSYLESLTFITHLSVQSLSGDTVKFRLTSRGGAGTLRRALGLSGLFEPLGPSEGAIPPLRLRR